MDVGEVQWLQKKAESHCALDHYPTPRDRDFWCKKDLNYRNGTTVVAARWWQWQRGSSKIRTYMNCFFFAHSTIDRCLVFLLYTCVFLRLSSWWKAPHWLLLRERSRHVWPNTKNWKSTALAKKRFGAEFIQSGGSSNPSNRAVEWRKSTKMEDEWKFRS